MRFEKGKKEKVQRNPSFFFFFSPSISKLKTECRTQWKEGRGMVTKRKWMKSFIKKFQYFSWYLQWMTHVSIHFLVQRYSLWKTLILAGKKFLKNETLDKRKANSCDETFTCVLPECATELSTSLHILFTNSLDQGKLLHL